MHCRRSNGSESGTSETPNYHQKIPTSPRIPDQASDDNNWVPLGLWTMFGSMGPPLVPWGFNLTDRGGGGGGGRHRGRIVAPGLRGDGVSPGVGGLWGRGRSGGSRRVRRLPSRRKGLNSHFCECLVATGNSGRRPPVPPHPLRKRLRRTVDCSGANDWHMHLDSRGEPKILLAWIGPRCRGRWVGIRKNHNNCPNNCPEKKS